MSNIQKANDKDLFILQSEKGDQWFVCNLLESNVKKAKDRQFKYEIIKVLYNEYDAKEALKKMLFFKSSAKNMKIVRKKKTQKEARKNIKEIFDVQ